jgi:hypothetical protein
LAHRIEVFQAEADRIDLAVAVGALRFLLVQVEPFARGEQLGAEAREFRDIGRGRRRRLVEELAQHPRPTLHRIGVLAVAAHRHDGRHAEQAPAWGVGGQRHFAKHVTRDPSNPVVLGQQRIDHHVICAEQCAQAAVVPQQGSEGLVDFLPRGRFYGVVELRIQLPVKLKQIEPFEGEPLT